MNRPTLVEEKTTGAIIAAFHEVHAAFGYGYRELIYAAAMERELRDKGRRVDREVPVMIYFRGKPLAKQVLDIIVDEKVVVEIKANESLHADASRQLFSYLRSSKLEVGLLLHFGREPRFYRVLYENRFKTF